MQYARCRRKVKLETHGEVMAGATYARLSRKPGENKKPLRGRSGLIVFWQGWLSEPAAAR